MASELLSVNVSAVSTVNAGSEPVVTGIFKEPVAGRVALRGVNLDGDEQADRRVHGGPDRAAYAYASEDYAWWETELARTLRPGKFGENFTVRGLDVSGARIGEEWQIGTAVVRVTSPRVPCFKLALAMDDPHFIKRFAHALRPGAYLRIISEGEVASGDTIAIRSRPAHDLTIATMAQIVLFERERARELLDADLPAKWRDWANEHVDG